VAILSPPGCVAVAFVPGVTLIVAHDGNLKTTAPGPPFPPQPRPDPQPPPPPVLVHPLEFTAAPPEPPALPFP
jgi:hypothetical protein